MREYYEKLTETQLENEIGQLESEIKKGNDVGKNKINLNLAKEVLKRKQEARSFTSPFADLDKLGKELEESLKELQNDGPSL